MLKSFLTRNGKAMLLSVLTVLMAITGVLAITFASKTTPIAQAYTTPPNHPYWDWSSSIDPNSVIVEGEALEHLKEYWTNPVDTGESIMYLNPVGSAGVGYSYCFDGELKGKTPDDEGLVMGVPCITNLKNDKKFVIVTYGLNASSEYSVVSGTGAFVMDQRTITTPRYINFSMPSHEYPYDANIYSGIPPLYSNPDFYLDSNGNYFIVVLAAMQNQIHYNYKTGYVSDTIPVVGVVYLGEEELYKTKEACAAAGDKLLSYASLKTIEKPTPKPLTYTGSRQNAFENTDKYTVTGGSATAAGTYKAKITPKTGYCWEDGSTEAIEVSFTIARKPISVPKAGEKTYSGTEKTAFYGGGTYNVVEGEGSVNKATDAGTYKVKLEPTANYCWQDWETYSGTGETDPVEVEWTIKKATIRFTMGDTPQKVTLKRGTSVTYSMTLSGSALLDNYTGHVEFKKTGVGDDYCRIYTPEEGVEDEVQHANCHRITLFNNSDKNMVTVTVRCELTEDKNFNAVRGEDACEWTIEIYQAGGFYIDNKDAGIDLETTTMYYDFAQAVEAYNKLSPEEQATQYIHVSQQAVIDKPVTIESPVKIIGNEGSELYLANSDQSMLNVGQGGELSFESVNLIDERTNPSGSAVNIAEGGEVTINNSSFTNCKGTNGGAIYVDGGKLTVTDSSFAENSATESGGAIYVAGGDVKIGKGVQIENNSAQFGNGIVVADDQKITVDSSAFGGLSDGIGLQGQSQINISGAITGEDKLVVEFEKPAEQLSEKYDNYGYVVSENNNSAMLKSALRVKNAGYTFNPDEKSNQLQMVATNSKTALVVIGDEEIECTTIEEAIQKIVESGSNSGKVYLLQHYNSAEDGVKPEPIKIDQTIEIPKGVEITFDSAVRVVNKDNTSSFKYYYNEKTGATLEDLKNEIDDFKNGEYSVIPTLLRCESLMGEMIKVESGATLNLGNVTLDGGAVWDEEMPAPDGETWKSRNGDTPIKLYDDGKSGAGTVTNNNAGVKAHAPVIVNAGTLNINSGATIQNNDNNYATPGAGFGSQNYGGGIRNEGAGQLTMNDGSTIKNCYSREGGAIMNVNKPDTSAYVEGGNPTVTIKGGTIEGNVSQTKGAAIQNVYGGAKTEVNGGTIQNNHSLNNVGVLTVEEGASLTVSGGTISAAESENAIYLYNQYSKEVVEGVQEEAQPYIENKSAGTLVIKDGEGTKPAISGNVHIDDPCVANAEEGKKYDPYADITDYSGALALDVNENRPSGKIAVGTKENLEALQEQINEKFTVDSSKHSGGYTVLVALDDGNYELRSASYVITVTQTESGKLEFTGFDPGITSFSVTIDGEEQELKLNENGAYVLEVEGTSVDITGYTFGYKGAENPVKLTDSLTLGVVQFNPENLELQLPEGATYLDEEGNEQSFTKGLLPNDIDIDEDGNITVKVDGQERKIHIGAREEAAEEADDQFEITEVPVLKDGKYSMTVEGKEGYEYHLADENGNLIADGLSGWIKTGKDGKVTFELPADGKQYTIVARNAATGDNLPGAYAKQGTISALTEDEAKNLEAYNTAYENVKDGLWTEQGKEPTTPATAENLKAVQKAYENLSERLQNLEETKEQEVDKCYPLALAREWKVSNGDILNAVKDPSFDPNTTENKGALKKAIEGYNDIVKESPEAGGYVAEEYNALIAAYKDAVDKKIQSEIQQWFEDNNVPDEEQQQYNDITSFFTSQIGSYNLNPADGKIAEAIEGLNNLSARISAAMDIQSEYNKTVESAEGKMSAERAKELYAANLVAILGVQNADEPFDETAAVEAAKAKFEDIKNKGIAEKLYLDAHLAIKGKEAEFTSNGNGVTYTDAAVQAVMDNIDKSTDPNAEAEKGIEALLDELLSGAVEAFKSYFNGLTQSKTPEEQVAALKNIKAVSELFEAYKNIFGEEPNEANLQELKTAAEAIQKAQSAGSNDIESANSQLTEQIKALLKKAYADNNNDIIKSANEAVEAAETEGNRNDNKSQNIAEASDAVFGVKQKLDLQKVYDGIIKENELPAAEQAKLGEVLKQGLSEIDKAGTAEEKTAAEQAAAAALELALSEYYANVEYAEAYKEITGKELPAWSELKFGAEVKDVDGVVETLKKDVQELLTTAASEATSDSAKKYLGATETEGLRGEVGKATATDGTIPDLSSIVSGANAVSEYLDSHKLITGKEADIQDNEVITGLTGATDLGERNKALAKEVNKLLEELKTEHSTAGSLIDEVEKAVTKAGNNANTGAQVADIVVGIKEKSELQSKLDGIIESNKDRISEGGKTTLKNELDGYLSAIDELAKDGDSKEAEEAIAVKKSEAENALQLSADKAIAQNEYAEAYKEITGKELPAGDAEKFAADIGEQTDRNGINDVLGKAVKAAADSLLIEDGDSEETKQIVEDCKKSVDEACGDNAGVPDLSGTVKDLKESVEAQRNKEKNEAKAVLDGLAEGDAALLPDELKTKLDKLIEDAKAQIDQSNYKDYKDIEDRAEKQRDLLVEYAKKFKDNDNGLKDDSAVTDALENGLKAIGEAAAADLDKELGKAKLDVEKEYYKQYLQEQLTQEDGERVKALVEKACEDIDGVVTNDGTDADEKVEDVRDIVESVLPKMDGERYLGGDDSVTRKDFGDVGAADKESIENAQKELAELDEKVKEYLDAKSKENGYESYEGELEDRLNKAEFELKKDEAVEKAESLLKDCDGKFVQDTNSGKVGEIEAEQYLPHKDPADRSQYAEERNGKIDEKYSEAEAYTKRAQEAQRNENTLQQQKDELAGSGRYNNSQKAELQSIVDDMAKKAKEAVSSGGSSEELAKLLDEAQKALGEVDVTKVTSGGINPDKTPSEEGGTGDYGEDYEGDLWGILSGTEPIESTAILVITEGTGRAKEVANAIKRGRISAAEGSGITSEQLADLTDGKSEKYAIEVRLTNNGAEYSTGGTYTVKVLMPASLRGETGRQVVRVNADGSIDVFKTHIEDGKYLVFTTNVLGEFQIIGDTIVDYTWLIVLLSILIGIEIILIAIAALKSDDGEGKDGSKKAAAVVPLPALAATIITPKGALGICMALGFTAIILAEILVIVLLLKKLRTKPTPANGNFAEATIIKNMPVADQTAAAEAGEAQKNEPEDK